MEKKPKRRILKKNMKPVRNEGVGGDACIYSVEKIEWVLNGRCIQGNIEIDHV